MNRARNIARVSGHLREMENRTPQPNVNKRTRRKLAAAQHRLTRTVEAAVIKAKEARPQEGGRRMRTLDKLTRDELRKLATERKIVGRRYMNKAQLVEALS